MKHDNQLQHPDTRVSQSTTNAQHLDAKNRSAIILGFGISKVSGENQVQRLRSPEKRDNSRSTDILERINLGHKFRKEQASVVSPRHEWHSKVRQRRRKSLIVQKVV